MKIADARVEPGRGYVFDVDTGERVTDEQGREVPVIRQFVWGDPPVDAHGRTQPEAEYLDACVAQIGLQLAAEADAQHHRRGLSRFKGKKLTVPGR